MPEDEQDKGKWLSDYLTGEPVHDTPEEHVRQSYLASLVEEYGYPKALIRTEIPIQSGAQYLTDERGNNIRADIVVYLSAQAARKQDQGNINFVVECKRREREDGYNQLVSYIFNTSAKGGVWTNGRDVIIYKRESQNNNQHNSLEQTTQLPRCGMKWDDDAIPDKDQLQRPKNIRQLLSTCHNKLYGRGQANADRDLTMDMVRLLLAKIQDETDIDEKPAFWITQFEYQTPNGRQEAVKRVQKLFRKYADMYPNVFDETETISIDVDSTAEAISVLQRWRLICSNEDAAGWDLMGAAYEQFTHANLKKQNGQFFTPRLVTDVMTKMAAPSESTISLDPAGGSGGFVTSIYRYVRQKIISQTPTKRVVRERQLDSLKGKVFSVEIAPRLVKVAKTAMLLSGDGQSGVTQGNSLGTYSEFDHWIQSRCMKGKPTLILTNPPFSGQKVESMVTDPQLLKNFKFGHQCEFDAETKEYHFDEVGPELVRQAPELLFIERCIDWLAEGGTLGMVLPKGLLDGQTYIPYRDYIFKHCRVDAVITLHKNTFEPDTGVRTCIVMMTKLKEGEATDASHRIFMAQSLRCGKNSRGEPIYQIDDNGEPMDKLSEDLSHIAQNYRDFVENKKFAESEYCFTVAQSSLEADYNINPQHYLPKLNEVLKSVMSMNERDGWSVVPIGSLPDIEIYMGPRWQNSNLVVENPSDTTGLTPYLTANATMEQRRLSIKWFDEKRASKKQKDIIQGLKVRQGDILISRSGTIGKVTYATKNLADIYVVSDDLIRVRAKDKKLQLYLLAFFMSSTALSLMKLDEYGSIQQHLQPRHIQEMPIPIPDDLESLQKLSLKIAKAYELMAQADQEIKDNGFDALFSRTLKE